MQRWLRKHCKSVSAETYPHILHTAKTHLNMFELMKPATLRKVVDQTRVLLARKSDHTGALALLGYASMALNELHYQRSIFQDATTSSNSTARNLGQYFSFFSHVSSKRRAGTDALGEEMALRMLEYPAAVKAESEFQVDLQAVALGYCICLNIDNNGIIVAVEGHEVDKRTGPV